MVNIFSKLKSKPYIIAEIGINHNEYLSIVKLIIQSKKAERRKISKRDAEDLINYNINISAVDI